MCRSYHCFNIISKNNANNIYFIFIGNHWQIASLVTQKSVFTVTHALFFIHFQFYCFLQMDIFFLRHMIHTLTNLVQLGAISVRAQQCNSTYTSHYANTEGVFLALLGISATRSSLMSHILRTGPELWSCHPWQIFGQLPLSFRGWRHPLPTDHFCPWKISVGHHWI